MNTCISHTDLFLALRRDEEKAMNIPEVLIVALTLLGECEGEPYAGKVMVAEVIANRANASRKSLMGVCLAPRQFSCWNGAAGKRLEARLCDWNTSVNNPAWKDCICIAKTICRAGYKPTTTADHYFNPKLCRPKWAAGMKQVAVVGNHEFYERAK